MKKSNSGMTPVRPQDIEKVRRDVERAREQRAPASRESWATKAKGQG